MTEFVYAIECRGHVKIGVSVNPKSRAGKVSADCPFETVLRGFVPGGYDLEHDLHERFSEYRVKGEWFLLRGDVAEWVEALPMEEPKPGRTPIHTHLKANRGKAVRLAEYLGLAPSTVSQWKNIPAEHVVGVEKFTGIPRQQLRPDLYEGMSAA